MALKLMLGGDHEIFLTVSQDPVSFLMTANDFDCVYGINGKWVYGYGTAMILSCD